MGLPGSGKTFLAKELKQYLECHGDIFKVNPTRLMNNEGLASKNEFSVKVDWFNADEIRNRFNDWDFSKEGRIRQSLRMAEFAFKCTGDFVICDFVAPLPEMRQNFKADLTIWIDTIDAGRYEDTNKVFVPPDKYDFRVTEQDAKRWAKFIGDKILNNEIK